MLKNVVLGGLALTISLFLGGCRQGDGPENIIKGIDVATSTLNGETYISLEAIVKIGELKLPKMETPIHHPDTSADIGTLTIESLQDGTNRVAVNINYSSVSHTDPALGATLPNGRELPSAIGAGSNILLGIPILESSRIYVGGEEGKDLFIGAAIGITALDSAVDQVPFPLNLFVGFPFSPEVYGVGGMYTSKEKGKSGMGIFARKSATPTPPTLARAPASVTEYEKLDRLTRFKLNRLLSSKRTLKIK